MSSEEEVATSDVDLWERLLSEQTALFRRTSSRNKDLEARVEELERELSVWKVALKAADDEKKTLNKAVLKLERNIGSLKDNNPLILCLIDGDGNIFSSDLISLGQAGGHQAAMILTKGLTDHLSDVDSPSRGQVWLTVYCNKTGLVETLIGNGACTPEQFEAFVTGFNQASPLFSFVDVGSGKERADEKIKECLRVFTRFPQTTKVFFGGAHDNGYVSTLNYLQNEGHLHKIIVLRGYKDLAFELKNMNLPSLEIDGLFMKKRLLTITKPNLGKTSSNRKPPITILEEDFDKFRSKSTTFARKSPTPTGFRPLDEDVPLHKQKPPPCNFFYLADCKHGQKCRYAHDYVLLPHHIDELQVNSVKWPCPFVNRGNPCPYGDSCCMGHACPKGRKCSFLKQGKCKFAGPRMHDNAGSTASKSHSRSSVSSPPDGSPAEYAFNSTLPSSPLSSPTKFAGTFGFSMGNDGRPVFVHTGGSSSGSLLSRLGGDAADYDTEWD